MSSMLLNPESGTVDRPVMDEFFSDRLLAAIEANGSPICVGIVPIFESLPDDIAGIGPVRAGNDAEAACQHIVCLTSSTRRISAPHVPIVKFQSPCFQKYFSEGVYA